MTSSYDAIIIGTGQAGPGLANRLARAGMKAAIVERSRFGGTCVNTGCIPTKTMVASAYAAHMARRAADFGVTIEGRVAVDMKQVKARKDQISGASRIGVETWLKGMENCTVYQGHARFESPHEVRVGEAKITAERIFLNVGGRATGPAIPGLEQVEYLNNTSMMEVDFLPQHLIIIGGSYIGLEFGQMFRRFGSEVTILEAGPRLIQHEDEDVSAAVQEILEREGIHIHANAKQLRVAKRNEAIIVSMDDARTNLDVKGSHLLVAVGRRPNTDDLGVEKAGINVDARGYIVVDDQLRTSVPGIWALGDCNGRGAFTHTSYNDFEIVAGNLLDGDSRKVSDRILAYALYIDPPLGRAGMTEAQVLKSGRKALVGRRPMTKVGRAVEKGETQGFMKIAVDAETKHILGAAILGTSGDEVIHTILDVMYAKAPYTVLQRAVHIHPTVSELVPTMLGSFIPSEMHATPEHIGLRQTLLDRLATARKESDKLFGLIRPECLYERPIAERHRFVFYMGHLEAFDWNLLQSRILNERTFDPNLDQLFAFGIDPVDGGLPSDQPADWPALGEVDRYKNRIRQVLDAGLVRALDRDLVSGDPQAVLLNTAIEHRLMHVETLAYMLHELPREGKIAESQVRVAASSERAPEMVEIPCGMVCLGQSHDDLTGFGWDNEYEAHSVQVPSFSVDRHKVANGQYLAFLEAGGYQNRSFWKEADWEWKSQQNITHPAFWKQTGGSWHYRGMFDEFDLPLHWPVYVSHAEASAFARWSGKALPTEAEWQRAAYGAVDDPFPWGREAPGPEHGYFDFGRWDSAPVSAFPRARSGFGVDGLLNNGWEWTSTPFEPFPGFQAFEFYPGYSADFFDGKHYVMKGASMRTAACMLRRSFRNWFQPHYQYAYAGFRCVSH